MRFNRRRDSFDVTMPMTPMAGREGGQVPIRPLLAGYALGSLEPFMHALIESHLILSPENRDFVRAMEEAAGAEIDGMSVPSMPRAARDEVLRAIYAGGWYGRPRPEKIDPDVPEPLMRLIGRKLDDIPWRFYGPGLRKHCLREDEGVTAQLFKVNPGKALPQHTHNGLEVTLVLRGSYGDGVGAYRRGDVAVADETVDHRPVADPREGCVCFAVTEGPVRMTGAVGRLIELVLRRRRVRWAT